MSGGVDSSVAALLLARQGHDLIGVSMQVWDYRNNGGSASRASCCAPDDFNDARRVAAKLNLPYYVFDFEKTFRTEVIDRFVSTYQAGATPNPCVDCNNRVKFRALRDRARAIGCRAVATGHYAMIEEREGRWHLLRGRDTAKDQSYFLYGLSQSELSETRFPIGHLTKPEVRELAREAGLVTAEKAESQDICFVSGTVSDFFVTIGQTRRAGAILDLDGKQVARHDGIEQFTVGQRRGIGVGGNDEPRYVLEILPESNSVIIGPRDQLEQDEFIVTDLNWIQPCSSSTLQAVAQLRHRHQGVEVEVSIDPDGRARCKFRGAWAPVSPGQAAVFYDLSNREVLGGGTIVRTPILDQKQPSEIDSINTASLC